MSSSKRLGLGLLLVSLATASLVAQRVGVLGNGAPRAGTVTPATTEPPLTPNTPSPADFAGNVAITSTLTWLASGATTYDVYFGTSPTPPNVATGQTSASYAPGTLSNNTLYYWYIIAKNSAGNTTGPTWRFTTIAASPPVPDAPNTPSPSNGASGVSLTPALTWVANGATTYDVYFGTASNPPLLVSAQSGATYGPSTLANSMVYYWKIVARNATGTTTGPIWSFTTLAATPPPPATPNSPSPTDFSSGISINPTLTWSSSGATTYDVYFSTSTNPGLVVSGQSSASYAPGPLANSTTYYWKIVSHNTGGAATGSIWRFSTISATTSGLLQSTNFTYMGAFYIPAGCGNFFQGGNGLAYRTAAEGGPSLYISSLYDGSSTNDDNFVAEIGIPALVITGDTSPTGVTGLNPATCIQTAQSITNGHMEQINNQPDHYVPGGLMVYNGRLFSTNYVYYDGGYTVQKSHFVHSKTLSNNTGAGGPYQVGTLDAPSGASGWLTGNHPAGLVAGGMVPIPTAWQSSLGGPALTGTWGIGIIGRSSDGPCASVFDPDQLGVTTPVVATPVVCYPHGPGHWLETYSTGQLNTYYNLATQTNSGQMAFPTGYDSLLFFGSFASGDWWYGYGSSTAYGTFSTVDDAIASGSNASTDSTGQWVTFPGVNLSGLDLNTYRVRLDSQTTPNIWTDLSHPGVTDILAIDAANFKVQVKNAFTPNLTSQAYHLGKLKGVDQTDQNQGPHGPPYKLYVYAYNANDLLAVKNGIRQPWDILPYAVWNWSLPYQNASPANVAEAGVNTNRPLGVAYDSSAQRIYIAQFMGDYRSYYPVIHVFDIH